MKTTRTIDNLGYDASERYAQDRKLLEGRETLGPESKIIFAKTSIEVTKPVTSPESHPIFEAVGKNTCWAEFSPPSGYGEQKRFFTHELIPEFGNKEKAEKLKEKIAAAGRDQGTDSGSDGRDDPSSKKEAWQQIKEKEEQEKDRLVLLNLFNCILDLDHCMIYVHTKRAQYHKG